MRLSINTLSYNAIVLHEITLNNKNGMLVKLSTYGACITHVLIPTTRSNLIDIVVGLDDLLSYPNSSFHQKSYLGSTCGRVCNRIANAEIELEGKVFHLTKNIEDKHHLHGGINAFNTRIWKIKEIKEEEHQCYATLQYTSEDGEEGYPGTMDIQVTFTLLETNALRFDYRVKTDKTSIVNLTNHSYFNLSGMWEDTILTHQLKISADYYLETDEDYIPTGKFLSVEEDPKMDFTQLRSINDNDTFDGYDHSYIFNKNCVNSTLFPCAILHSKLSGITMKVFTSCPSAQLYTANHFDGKNPCKSTQNPKKTYNKYAALCLETQFHPDAIHHAQKFPSITIHSDDNYHQWTLFQF